MGDETKFVPKVALDYIKNKKLEPAFSYKDVWNEEHATAFTVAKAMQIDVLADMKKAVEKAISDGHSFEHFKKDLKPILMGKGWWGKKEMKDPLTGDTIRAQLGSDRRLKTIYNVNLRSAYQKAQYDRTMESDMHPYLMYRIGNSKNHREEHVRWNGLILPKDDPWWNSHLPPNGYGCNCYTRAVSEARKQRYESEGIPVAPTFDGQGGGTLRVKTEAPPTVYRVYYNERKDILERIPKGITPGFNWNQGKARSENLKAMLVDKIDKAKKIFSGDGDWKKALDGIFDSEKAKEILEKQTPVDPKILERVINTLEKQDIKVVISKETDNYLEKTGREGIVFSTGDIILHSKVSTAGLFEEIIHLKQIKHLKKSSADDWWNLDKYERARFEIAAKKKLLKNAQKYGITEYEQKIIQESITYYQSVVDSRPKGDL